MTRLTILIFLASFLAWTLVSANDEISNAKLDADQYDFGTVTRGTKVELDIGITNLGSNLLPISGINSSLPNLKSRSPRTIDPKQKAKIYVELDTAPLIGSVEGTVTIKIGGQVSQSLEANIKGRVESNVELNPDPPVFLQAFRWNATKAQRLIAIQSRSQERINNLHLESDGDEFLATLVPIGGGDSYQLSVKLNPESPSKRAVGSITLITDRERVKFPVYTFLRDEVYTFPAAIQFPPFKIEDLQKSPEQLDFLKQSLFVYQYMGTDFQIQIQSVPDYMLMEKTPASGHGAVIDIPNQGRTAVFELVFSPNLDRLKKGSIRDTITIGTNDPNFPTISVPLSLQVD